MSPTITSSEQIYCSSTTIKARNTKVVETPKIKITTEKDEEGYSKTPTIDDDSDGTTTPPSSDEDDYPDQVIFFI